MDVVGVFGIVKRDNEIVISLDSQPSSEIIISRDGEYIVLKEVITDYNYNPDGEPSYKVKMPIDMIKTLL